MRRARREDAGALLRYAEALFAEPGLSLLYSPGEFSKTLVEEELFIRSHDGPNALLAQLPDRERGILDVLVHLTRLRRRTGEVFPDARAFVRPGFDDGSADEDNEQPDAAGA